MQNPPSATSATSGPFPVLRLIDTVALVVGVVVGAGIFRAPALIAAEVPSVAAILVLWLLGGLVSLVGAACYAELACAFPHPGGDYHFLHRALGPQPAFLFAWARLTVIPTGSLALLAFIFGDYASQLFGLGAHSSAIWAAALVVGLTAANAAHLRHGRRTQNVLTTAVILGLAVVIAAGLSLTPPGPAPPSASAPGASGVGLAMVFVLLTYGGWNEAAYISAEQRGGRRRIALALTLSLGAVTVLYLLVNSAYLHALGVQGVAGSDAVAATVMQRAFGPAGAVLISLLVSAAVITSANATLLMGSRTLFAFGRDFPLFSALGRWSQRGETPTNAVLAQGAAALVLVGFGALSRRGFETMVEYTAPVFWLFFLLTGISLIVLRRREPEAERPFRVPLYPLTPLLFCLTSAALLYSSIAYSGVGASVGLLVLATGLIPMRLAMRLQRPGATGALKARTEWRPRFGRRGL